MDIGQAIAHAKNGKRVSRAGWNSQQQYVYYVPAGRYAPTSAPGHEIAGKQEDGLVPYREYLALKTAQGDVATWAPSCSDTLATDWLVSHL